MKKLIKRLDQIQKTGEPGFMMHMVAGYPDLASSEQIAEEIFRAGADLLEVQIPFSDPVADGPVIAEANEVALKNGVTVRESLAMIQRIVANHDQPVLIMTYFNIIHHYGVVAFCRQAADIGAQGLIVPDYPYDEESSNALIQAAGKHGLALIQVLASTTREDRILKIAEHGSGFIYCMARTGTTGKKTEVTHETTTYLKTVRSHTSLPLAVGFGLTDKSQVEALKPYAEIMVVGSALIREYADRPLAEGLVRVNRFIHRLKDET